MRLDAGANADGAQARMPTPGTEEAFMQLAPQRIVDMTPGSTRVLNGGLFGLHSNGLPGRLQVAHLEEEGFKMN